MDAIPSWFWMIIITGLSAMIGLIFFYMAMLLRETTMSMREIRYMIIELHELVDSVKIILEKGKRVLDTVVSTTDAISVAVMRPVKVVGSIVSNIESFFAGFFGKFAKG